MRCVLSLLIAASTLGAGRADDVGHRRLKSDKAGGGVFQKQDDLSGEGWHVSPSGHNGAGNVERSTITGAHVARLKSSKVGAVAIKAQERLLGKDSDTSPLNHGGAGHIEHDHSRGFARSDAATETPVAQVGGGAIQEQGHVTGRVSHAFPLSQSGAGHVEREHPREIALSDATKVTHMGQLEPSKAGEGAVRELGHLPGQDSAEAEKKHVIERKDRRSSQMMLRSARVAVSAGVADRRQNDAPSVPAIPSVVSKVAASATERWRLIAAGMLPADAAKSSDSHLQPLPGNAPPAEESHKQAANASDPSTSHHELQQLAGEHSKSLWSYHTEAHAHRDVPEDDDKLKSKDGQNTSHGQYTSGGHDKYEEPREFLGLPKIFWALVADVIAMACFVACIPFILTIAKRRRPLSS